MELHKVGDKSKALCPFCKQLCTTTFEERDVPLSSGKGLVRDVLVAVCDTCDRVVAIPQQSAPRIKETVRFSRHSLETRIPRHLLDAVALACYELGFGTDCAVVLFRYYLQRVASEPRLRSRLALLSASNDAQGRASARFSAKLNDELNAALLDLERTSRLKKADVVKGVIVQMKQDILDAKRKDVRKDVQRVLRLAG
jgi:hypothetical protein